MFSNYTYYIFLFAVALIYRWIPVRVRPLALTLAGVGFYTFQAGLNILLLVTLSVVTWLILFWGRPANSDKTSIPKWRPRLAISLSLGTLVFFKYSGLLGKTLGLPIESYPAAPLAISFFIFEFIHVAAETAKGTISYIAPSSYFSFVAFFPTMVAGPIKRYEQFQTYFEAPRATEKDVLEGVFRILLGLFKKVVLADNLNTLIGEIGHPKTIHNVPLLTLAVGLYGFRIWLDFAGYSDIAIGSSRLFGIRVPENFLHPYLQRNITEFWRHWHISLSTWIMDYIYIPLGGSRRGLPRQLVNIMIVMAASGMWHGASWNFLLWGLWHGFLLCCHKLTTEYVTPRLPKSLVDSFGLKVASWATTMIAVWFGWMLFMWQFSDIVAYLGLLTGGRL